MADLGELILRLKLDDDQYIRGLQQARRQAETLKDVEVKVRVNPDDSLKQAQDRIRQQAKRPVDIPVRTDTKKAEGQYRDALGRLREANGRFAKDSRSSFESVYQGIGIGVGNILVDALQTAGRLAVDAFVGFFGSAISEFQKFDQAVTNFTAKAGTTAPDQIAAFAEEARNLAAQTAFVPKQVADLGTQLLALGVSAEDVTDRLGGITKLADVLGEDPVITGRVVQGGLAAYEQFGLTTEDLTDKINKLITTTAAGGRSGVAEFEQLFSKAAGPAAELGVSIDDLTASFAAIRQTGATARVAATGIRNALTTIASEGEKLKAAGIDAVFDTSGALDFEATVRNIGAALEGLSGAEKVARLDELFGAGAGPAIIALISQIDTSFQAAKSSVEDFEGSVDESLEVVNQSLERQRELLSGNFASFLVDVGASLEGALTGIVGALNQILSSLSVQDLGLDSLTEAGQRFNEVILNSPEFIEGIAQGLAATLRFFNQIIERAIELGTQFIQNQDAVDFVGRQFSIVGERIASIVELIGVFGQGIGEIIVNISELFGLGETLQNTFEGGNIQIQIFTDILGGVLGLLADIVGFFANINTTISDATNGVASFANGFRVAFAPVTQLLAVIRNVVSEFEELEKINSSIGETLTENLNAVQVGTALGDAASNIAASQNQQKEEQAAAEEERQTEREFEEELLQDKRDFEDSERAKKLAFEDELEARKLRTEQQVNSLREQLQSREESFNRRQEQIKNEGQRNRQELEERFNREQERAKAEFERQQNEEARAFNEQLNEEERRALQQLDRETQLAEAESPEQRRELEEQFAREDELAAKRAEIEAEFEQRRREFEEQQRLEDAAFEEQQRAEARAFEEQINDLARQTQAELESNERAFLQEKAQIEAQIDATKRASEEEILQRKREFEDAERARQRAFEDEERARKQAFEDAQNESELNTANEVASIEEEQRRLDEQNRIAEIEAEAEKYRIAAQNRAEERKLLADLERFAREGGSLSGIASDALTAGITAFRTGGTVEPGQVGLAGEAGPELFKFRSGETGLFTQPTLFKAPSMGRIYSAPKTSRKMSGSLAKDSLAADISKMNKLLKQSLSKPSGQVTTNVQLDGAHPEQVRRQLSRMQVELWNGMSKI